MNMKSRMFELSSTLIGRIKCVWLVHLLKSEGAFVDCPPENRPKRREPQVSLELIEAEVGCRATIVGLNNLKTLRDELDKVIYIAEAMTIDQTADEEHVRDLYGNNMSIKYAIEHGLLRETKKEV